MHADALYVNDAIDSLRESLSTKAVAQALVALAAYRQDDLVLSLLSAPHPTLAALSEHDRVAIAGALLPSGPSWVSRTLGKLLAWRFSNRQLRARIDALRAPDATDWHDPEYC
jgi:hypothetical protein